MSLTTRQRAKVNAALCIIHDQGGDANAVTRLARTIMATGHNPGSAYERALKQYVETNPEVGAVISKTASLIDASDDRTVVRYDMALASYIETGDETAVNALAPMVADGMTALAVRNGEEPPVFDAMPSDQPQGDAFAFNTEPAPETVAGRPVVGRDADGEIVRTTSQLSLGGTTGMVAPRAARQWAGAPHVGMVSSPSPSAGAASFVAAKEAARAAAANPGRAVIVDAAEST